MSDRDDFVAGLRELADLYESTSDAVLPLPVEAKEWGGDAFEVYGLRDQGSLAAAASALGGLRTKSETSTSGELLQVTRSFGPFRFSLIAPRDEVCERVQVGEQEIEREVVITPAETTTETVTEPVYEWRCSSILASGLVESGGEG